MDSIHDQLIGCLKKINDMKNFLQKYWINALGIGFLFTALLYFLKLAVANDWFPLELRLMLSTLLGLSGLFFGFRFIQKDKAVLGQVLAGVGTAVLYATIAFISFSDEIHWSNGSLLTVMVALGITVSGTSIRHNQRILFALSVLGGLITPFVIEATHSMDIPLFIYVLVINVGAIYASIVKGWKENIVMAFFMTIGLFASYYFFFDSVDWVRPFFYITVLFVIFLIGFVIISFKKKDKSDPIDLLLGAFNGINYIFWSSYVLDDFQLSYTIPFSIVGVLFLALAIFFYIKSNREAVVAFCTYLVLSLVTLGIVGNDLSLLYDKGGMNYVIVAAVWLVLISVVFFMGKKMKDLQVFYFSLIAFFGLVIYWFINAWEVDWVSIFGIKYIPFLNPGALIWMGLIILGFLFAIDFRKGTSDPESRAKLDDAALVAIVSHILIGGLLTIQIMNLWDAYNMSVLNQNLTLSLCWFVYALIIFLWNKYTEHKFFKRLGAFVLIVSTLKVVVWDLNGESSIEKIIFLLILGGITLAIGKLHNKKVVTTDNVAEEQDQNME